MGELFGPIIGITLVLMSVFLPAAFLPGLTGQLYQQFALVIAATALISAVNAVTLKPTQCALWLRPEAPPERRNLFYRIFNRVYDAAERGYTALIRRMVHHSAIVALLGVALIGVAFFGLARLPTAFIPLEDQGYLIVSAQLPDAASLERTQRVMEKVTNVAKGIAGVDQVVAISGISVLDNSASLPNAGVAYVVLKSWDERYRAKGQDLLSLFKTLRAALQQEILEANTTVIPPPPIQGIGNSGGFTMVVELRDGSSDFAKLQSVATGIVNDAKSQSAVQTVFSPFRASAPQLEAIVDRNKAETLGVTVGQVFQALGSYIGSTYVGQINKFGRVFQVYVQSEPQFRTTPGDIAEFKIKTPAWNARSDPEGYRPIAYHALQPLSRGDHRRNNVGAIQLRRNHGADGTDSRESVAAWRELRLDGDVLPGEGDWQSNLLCFRACDFARLSCACRPI
jgi:HAE1 family hydrophobic/amphiphilic exporter-1